MFIPKYTISDQVLSQLSEIAEIKALVAKSKLLPEREIFLRREAAIKMAHTSTSIEGNELQEYQVAQVAKGERINAEVKQILEVKNYLSALKEVDKLAESKKGINSKDVLRIHRIIMRDLVASEKLGNFRFSPVYIVNILPDGREEVAYTPPLAGNVSKLIEDLLNWTKGNEEIHPVVRAGLLHYQFETIHPFTDGNGRTGRLLTLLHLYQSGWDFRKILVLEDYYNRDREAYYKALQTGETYKSRQTVDLGGWLEYFVTGFLDEARRVKDQILSLSAITSNQATRKTLDKDELKIVDFVVTVGQVTSADVVDFLGVPKRTAQSKLKNLEDIKVLKKAGSGPATYYVAA